jgi:hypothetical protein
MPDDTRLVILGELRALRQQLAELERRELETAQELEERACQLREDAASFDWQGYEDAA